MLSIDLSSDGLIKLVATTEFERDVFGICDSDKLIDIDSARRFFNVTKRMIIIKLLKAK